MTQLHLSDRLSKLGCAGISACLLVLPAVLAVSTRVLAQTGGTGGTTGTNTQTNTDTVGGISIAISTIAGESQDTVGTKWISLADCNDDAKIEFRLDTVPSERESLAIFVGEACNMSASRDGEGTDCDHIADHEINGLADNVVISLSTQLIVKTAFGTDDCGSQSSRPQIWFLAVDDVSTTANIEKADYVGLKLDIDTDPPDAPTSITGGTGENEIPVTWKVGSQRVNSFTVYVDSGNGGGVTLRDSGTTPEPEPTPNSDDGGSDTAEGDGDGDDEPTTAGETNATCGTGALTKGGNASLLPSSVRKRDVDSTTATETKLPRSYIDGDKAAVAVVAIDEAGNESPLSEVKCVEVVPTTGFKDQYIADNGEIPQGCPCAATGPVHFEGALPIGVALSVLAYRRRRRS